MQFSSALACFLLSVLPSLSEASPIAARQQIPTQFALKTQVIPGGNTDYGSNKDGLTLFSYHTGAGLGVAAAQVNETTSWFQLNGTTLEWTYPNNQLGAWPVTIEYGAYQAFNEISISIAEGPATPGFSVSPSGLHYNGSTRGWAACDWWLESPMIFSLVDGFEDIPLPASCSLVNLLAYPLGQ